MENRRLEDLNTYDKNPRFNEDAVNHVVESLKVHGQINPIIISAVGHPFDQEVICCGHTRLEALKRYGASEAKVLVHEFKDEKEFIDLNIRDNKSGEFAQWDEDKLRELSLDFDLNLGDLGFEIDDLFDDEPDEKDEKFEIVVKCSTGSELEEVYNKLKGLGFKCKKK